jgi:hypothetical protein
VVWACTVPYTIRLFVADVLKIVSPLEEVDTKAKASFRKRPSNHYPALCVSQLMGGWKMEVDMELLCVYRQTPIFRHPFFRKQCFSLKYALVAPFKIFRGLSKIEIYVILKSSVQFLQ